MNKIGWNIPLAFVLYDSPGPEIKDVSGYKLLKLYWDIWKPNITTAHFVRR